MSARMVALMGTAALAVGIVAGLPRLLVADPPREVPAIALPTPDPRLMAAERRRAAAAERRAREAVRARRARQREQVRDARQREQAATRRRRAGEAAAPPAVTFQAPAPVVPAPAAPPDDDDDDDDGDD